MKTQEEVYLTPSEIIEYLFCPRFIYFMNCLSIPQYEEKRYKVLKGRNLHKERQKINPKYLRKKIHCTKKELSVYLVSSKYHLKGIVDEVLFLKDGTLAPFDYKFAEYRDTLYRTHKYQSVAYALMIMDNFDREAKRGYICYTRSKYLVKEIVYQYKDFLELKKIITEMLLIIQKGYFPKKTRYAAKCIDCCYKNICVM